VEPCRRRVRIEHRGILVAETTRALRVLETSHPPGIYVPAGDVSPDIVEQAALTTVCEFKGRAAYWDLVIDGVRVREAAWSYPSPAPGYAEIAGHLSFYPGKVDACFLDEERVRAQEGSFYGGWITDDIVGPFKGGAGTLGW